MTSKGTLLKTGLVWGLAIALILTGAAQISWGDSSQITLSAPSLSPIGTAFGYGGHLKSGGTAINGQRDMEFALFDASALGNQVGITVTLDNVVLEDGVFQVALDFGNNLFGGGARWMQVGVRDSASTGPFTLLNPRVPLRPVPYALALPNVFTDQSANFVGVGRNFRISGNEVFGVRYTGNANQYGGMYVETSDASGWPFYGYATNGSFRAWTYYDGSLGDWFLYNAGIRLHVPNEGGLRIGPSLDHSLVISNTPGSDGIRVLDTGDDAIQIGSNPDIPNYGVYIPSPGVSTYGLWSNTSNAAGEWALYSVDNIQAGNVLASALSLIARVSGPDALESGHVVAVSGMGDAVPGGQSALPLVRLADGAQYNGVIGVVARRMVWALAPGKEDEGAYSLQSADGPAAPGDYVSLVVMGVTQVRVDNATTIKAGDRLTAGATGGRARALQKRIVEGMAISEGAPVIGIALATPEPGAGTIPVFVTLK